MAEDIKNPTPEVSAEQIQILIAQTNDEDSDVVRDAIYELGALQNPSPEVIQTLIEKIDAEDLDVAMTAIHVLGNLQNPSPEIIQTLIKKTDDKNHALAEAAINALGALTLQNPSPDAIQTLIEKAEDKNYHLAAAAIDALATLKNPPDNVIDTLIQALDKGGIPTAKISAIDRLTQLALENPYPNLIEALIAATKNDDEENDDYAPIKNNHDVRIAAFEALIKLKQPDAEWLLVELMAVVMQQYRVGKLQCFAVKALEKLESQNPLIVPILLRTMESKNKHVRISTIEALENRLKNSFDAFMPLILPSLRGAAAHDKDEQVRTVATKALENLPLPNRAPIEIPPHGNNPSGWFIESRRQAADGGESRSLVAQPLSSS